MPQQLEFSRQNHAAEGLQRKTDAEIYTKRFLSLQMNSDQCMHGRKLRKARRLLLREKSHLKGEEETMVRAHKAPSVVFVFTSCRRKTAIHEVLRFFRIALPQ